jgi:hypothetical protein
MLYEFAVEPPAVAEWSTCRYVLDHMGTAHGRMIAEFPRRKLWKKMVRDACDARGLLPKERARVVEKLESLKDKMLRARRPYDEARKWMPNVVEQHAITPFHAVIACEGTLPDGKLLVAKDIDETTPLWRVPRESKVPRQAPDLARHLSPLLQISSRIRFVDKLFDPESHRGKWRPMLAHCLTAAVDGGRALEVVEYHTVITGDRRPSLDVLKERCRARLPAVLPPGVRIRVVFWRLPHDPDSAEPGKYKELLHARYVLTNRGGYRVETGLDVGTPGQNQDVSLLDEQLRDQRWAELDDGAGVFEFAGDVWVP